MSSTEVAISPTKKKTKQQNMDQIVSSENTNGCNDVCFNDIESENQQKTLINNLNDTNNKECHVDDACMEPLLIQDCVNDNNDEKFVVTNISNSVHSDDNSNSSSSDMPFNDQNSPNDEGGGGHDNNKPNLCLKLNLESGGDNIPKNKKFLDSSEDQIMNQIFFQTISVTPTTEDEILGSSKFLSNENTPMEERLQPVDFFNRKIDEDDTFEDKDPNLCSLNDNFSENYCSFSSIDYNPTNIRNNLSDEGGEPDSELLQPDTFLGEYAETMRQQRPSIVIDCYDDSDNSKTGSDDENDGGRCRKIKNSSVVILGNEKINDYCFYFDQTIEEDDDDAYIQEGTDDADDGAGVRINAEEEEKYMVGTDAVNAEMENGKTLDHDVVMMMQGEEDECFETEEDDEEGDEEIYATNDFDAPEDDMTVSDDEGVINESVNVSGLLL